MRRIVHSGLARLTPEAAVDDELRFHIDARVDDLVRGGMTPDAARAEAMREFGDLTAARRELTQMDRRAAAMSARSHWWADIGLDVRFAFRSLRRQPGFAAALLITLALGIGANSGIFTLVHAALLEPLPYRDPGRLFHLWETREDGGTSEASFPDFQDWRSGGSGFAALEGYDPTNITVTGSDASEMLHGARVTGGLFDMLGVPPLLGRTFRAGEDGPGGAAVTVLSHGYWQREFGGDRHVIGRTLNVNRAPHEIIGVMPAGFHFAPAGDAELWFPLDRAAGTREQRFNHWLNVVGRLEPSVTPDEGFQRLSVIMRRLAGEHPETNSGRGIMLVPLREQITGDVEPILAALFAAVGLLLLIACANVAGLLLARSLTRDRELAVRAAIGASRGRLLRQLLTESVIVACVGAVLGVGIANVMVRGLVAAIPDSMRDNLAYIGDAGVNGTVLLFTAAVSLAAGLGFGLVPAWTASRAGAMASAGSGRTTAAGARVRFRNVLVGAELALTAALLVGTGLVARSLVRLLDEDPGFRPEQVITARVPLSGAPYQDDAAQRRFFETLIERVRALPGARDAGAVTNLPLNGGGTNTFRVEGQPEADAARRPDATMRGVAGDYFRVMGIRLVGGRLFTARDDTLAQPAIVVSEAIARLVAPSGSAVGQRLRFYAFPDTTWEIIGVVGDVKTGALDAPAPPTIYYSHLQGAENRMSIVVRGTDAAGLIAGIRSEVRALDAALPVYQVNTMVQVMAGSQAVFLRRFTLLLIGAFGAAALALAVVGVYGVIAYAVARRTRELGIRAALGATARQLSGLVVRQGVALAAIGVSTGIVLALVLSRFLGTLLYGVPASDPVTYLAVAVVLGALAIAASWVPARRAGKVSPASVLRAE